MSIIRRAFAVGFCASIFLLGGCTTNVQQPADLSARSHDPRGLISGLPAAGEAVCLTAASDHSPTIDIAVRQALRDRGYKAVMLSAQESPRPKQCRLFRDVAQCCREIRRPWWRLTIVTSIRERRSVRFGNSIGLLQLGDELLQIQTECLTERMCRICL